VDLPGSTDPLDPIKDKKNMLFNHITSCQQHITKKLVFASVVTQPLEFATGLHTRNVARVLMRQNYSSVR
jgi:hypothetical protein